MEKIKILLVGEDQDSAGILGAILGRQGEFDVIGPATSWAEMCYLLLAHSPQLALLDLESPAQGVLESIKIGRALSPDTRFVGLTDCSDPEEVAPSDLDATLTKRLPISQTLLSLTRLAKNPPSGESSPADEPGSQLPPGVAGSPGLTFLHMAAGKQGLETEEPSTAHIVALDTGRRNGKPSGAELWAGEPHGDPDGIIPTFDTINLQVGPFASFRTLAAFQNALNRLEGVMRVKVRRFYRGTLYASVQYSGILPLAERLTALSDFNPKVVADDAGNLHVSIELEGLPEIGAAPRLD